MHSTAQSMAIENVVFGVKRDETARWSLLMPVPVSDVLAAHKKQLFGEILDMVPVERRRECQRLLVDFEDTIEKLAGRSKKYAGCSNAIEAVVKFLNEQRVPATEKEIADEVIGGGLWGGDPDNRSRITASINVHINGPAKIRGKNPLKKINGLIGPEHWDDALFR
jgi:hypothetical protein